MTREMVIFITRGHLVHCRDLQTGDLWVINPGWEDIGAKMEAMKVPLRVRYEVYQYLDMPLPALGTSLRESFGEFAKAVRSGLSKKEEK